MLAFTGAGAKKPSERSRAMALERAKAEQEIAHFQRELDKANRLADDLALRLKQQADDHGRAISARQRDSDKILEVCILALLCAHFDMHARIGDLRTSLSPRIACSRSHGSSLSCYAGCVKD